MTTAAIQDLNVIIRLRDGSEITLPLHELAQFELSAGDEIILVDPVTGVAPEGLEVRQSGNDAIIELDGEEVGRLEAFYTTPEVAFYPEGVFPQETATDELAAVENAASGAGNASDDAGKGAMMAGGLFSPVILGGIGLGGLAIAAAANSSSSSNSGSSSSPTLTVDVDDEGVVSFGGSATGSISIEFHESGVATVTREGVTSTAEFELADFNTNATGTESVNALRINAEDGANLTFSGDWSALEAIVFDVEDGPLGEGEADRKDLTLDTSDLEGVQKIIFSFEDQSDFVVLSADSDLSNFDIIEVQKGTADLRDVAVNDGVEFVVNSEVVLTFDQFKAAAGLVSSTGLGRLTIVVESNEQLAELSDILVNNVLIGFGNDEPGELNNIKIEAAPGAELDDAGVANAITEIRDSSSPSLFRVGELIADLEERISGLDEDLSSEIDAVVTDLSALKALLDGLDGRTDGIETQLAAIETTLADYVQGELDVLEQKLQGEGVEEDDFTTLSALKGLLDGLDNRTDEIEARLEDIETALILIIEGLMQEQKDWVKDFEGTNVNNSFSAAEVFGHAGTGDDSPASDNAFLDTFAARIEGYDPATVPLDITDPLTVEQAVALSQAGFDTLGVNVTYTVEDIYAVVKVALGDPDQRAALAGADQVVAKGTPDADEDMNFIGFGSDINLRIEGGEGDDVIRAGTGGDEIVGGPGANVINLPGAWAEATDSVIFQSVEDGRVLPQVNVMLSEEEDDYREGSVLTVRVNNTNYTHTVGEDESMHDALSALAGKIDADKGVAGVLVKGATLEIFGNIGDLPEVSTDLGSDIKAINNEGQKTQWNVEFSDFPSNQSIGGTTTFERKASITIKDQQHGEEKVFTVDIVYDQDDNFDSAATMGELKNAINADLEDADGFLRDIVVSLDGSVLSLEGTVLPDSDDAAPTFTVSSALIDTEGKQQQTEISFSDNNADYFEGGKLRVDIGGETVEAEMVAGDAVGSVQNLKTKIKENVSSDLIETVEFPLVEFDDSQRVDANDLTKFDLEFEVDLNAFSDLELDFGGLNAQSQQIGKVGGEDLDALLINLVQSTRISSATYTFEDGTATLSLSSIHFQSMNPVNVSLTAQAPDLTSLVVTAATEEPDPLNVAAAELDFAGEVQQARIELAEDGAYAVLTDGTDPAGRDAQIYFDGGKVFATFEDANGENPVTVSADMQQDAEATAEALAQAINDATGVGGELEGLIGSASHDGTSLILNGAEPGKETFRVDDVRLDYEGVKQIAEVDFSDFASGENIAYFDGGTLAVKVQETDAEGNPSGNDIEISANMVAGDEQASLEALQAAIQAEIDGTDPISARVAVGDGVSRDDVVGLDKLRFEIGDSKFVASVDKPEPDQLTITLEKDGEKEVVFAGTGQVETLGLVIDVLNFNIQPPLPVGFSVSEGQLVMEPREATADQISLEITEDFLGNVGTTGKDTATGIEGEPGTLTGIVSAVSEEEGVITLTSADGVQQQFSIESATASDPGEVEMTTVTFSGDDADYFATGNDADETSGQVSISVLGEKFIEDMDGRSAADVLEALHAKVAGKDGVDVSLDGSTFTFTGENAGEGLGITASTMEDGVRQVTEISFGEGLEDDDFIAGIGREIKVDIGGETFTLEGDSRLEILKDLEAQLESAITADGEKKGLAAVLDDSGIQLDDENLTLTLTAKFGEPDPLEVSDMTRSSVNADESDKQIVDLTFSGEYLNDKILGQNVSLTFKLGSTEVEFEVNGLGGDVNTSIVERRAEVFDAIKDRLEEEGLIEDVAVSVDGRTLTITAADVGPNVLGSTSSNDPNTIEITGPGDSGPEVLGNEVLLDQQQAGRITFDGEEVVASTTEVTAGSALDATVGINPSTLQVAVAQSDEDVAITNPGSEDGENSGFFGDASRLGESAGVRQGFTNPEDGYEATDGSPAENTDGETSGDDGLFGSDPGVYTDEGLRTTFLVGGDGDGPLYIGGNLTHRIRVNDEETIGEAPGTDQMDSEDIDSKDGFAEFDVDDAHVAHITNGYAGADVINNFQVGHDLIVLEEALAMSTFNGDIEAFTTTSPNGSQFDLSQDEFGVVPEGMTGFESADLGNAYAVADMLNSMFDFKADENEVLNTSIFAVTASDDPSQTAIWAHQQSSSDGNTVDAMELYKLALVNTIGDSPFTAENFIDESTMG